MSFIERQIEMLKDAIEKGNYYESKAHGAKACYTIYWQAIDPALPLQNVYKTINK